VSVQRGLPSLSDIFADTSKAQVASATGDDPHYNAASSTAEETNYENSDYNVASVGSAETGLYQNTPNCELATTKYYITNASGDFQGSTTSSLFGNNLSNPLSKTYSSPGSSDSFGTASTSPRISYALSNQEYDTSGEITRNMGGLSFSLQPTIPELGLQSVLCPLIGYADPSISY
jgi:hypothetical protein